MNETDRVRWAQALLVAGWLFVGAYLTYLVARIRLAAAVTTSSFSDGVWGQRLEQVSFSTLPQNVTILIAGTAAAIGAGLLVRSIVDPVVVRIALLVRIVAGLSLLVFVLATVGFIEIMLTNPDSLGDTQSILGRIGGAMMALGSVRLCTEAERHT